LLDAFLHRGGSTSDGVEAAADARAVSLERRKDVMSHARTSESWFRVARVLIGGDSAPLKKLDDIAPPDVEQRPHVEASRCRHAAKPGKSAAPHEVKYGSLHDIVSRVGQGNRVGAHLGSGQVEKLIAQRAGSSLDRAARNRRIATSRDKLHAQPGA
jgi:hypothetical protein